MPVKALRRAKSESVGEAWDRVGHRRFEELLFEILRRKIRSVTAEEIIWRLERGDSTPLRQQQKNVRQLSAVLRQFEGGFVQPTLRAEIGRVATKMRTARSAYWKAVKGQRSDYVQESSKSYELLVSEGHELCRLAAPSLLSGYEIMFGMRD